MSRPHCSNVIAEIRELSLRRDGHIVIDTSSCSHDHYNVSYHRQLDCLFYNISRPTTTKKTLHINGPVWWDPIWIWILLTKGQLCGTRLSWRHYARCLTECSSGPMKIYHGGPVCSRFRWLVKLDTDPANVCLSNLKKNVIQILTWFIHMIYVNLNYLIGLYLHKWKEIHTLKRYNLIGIYLSSSYILQFIVNNCHCSIILISIWTGHYTLLSYHSGSRDPAYHYNDVIMSASSTVRLKSPASRLFT